MSSNVNKTMEELRAEYAAKKVVITHKQHGKIAYHPEIAQHMSGWQYKTKDAIHNFGDNKDFAIESRNHHKTFTTVSKLRYGNKRKTSGYGYQRRHQVSCVGGLHKPDAVGDFNMVIFENTKLNKSQVLQK